MCHAQPPGKKRKKRPRSGAALLKQSHKPLEIIQIFAAKPLREQHSQLEEGPAREPVRSTMWSVALFSAAARAGRQLRRPPNKARLCPRRNASIHPWKNLLCELLERTRLPGLFGRALPQSCVARRRPGRGLTDPNSRRQITLNSSAWGQGGPFLLVLSE